jgi:LysM repeat protein
MVIVMTPIVEEPAANAVAAVPAESVTGGETEALALADSLVTPLPDPNAAQTQAQKQETSIMAAAATQAPIGGVGGPQPTETESAVSAAPESLPTQPPAATNTPLLTPTSLPPTATALPATATSEPVTIKAEEVKAEGMAETLAASETEGATEETAEESSAERSAAPVAMAAAGATSLPTATASPTSLLASSPSVATTPLPAPTATPIVYQVQSGDTLVTIAAEYDVDVEALMAANDMSEQDVYLIQPGQMLFIPMPAPEQVVMAASALSAIRVESPLLLMPSDGATVGCATGGTLIWQRVQFVKDSDKYVLHLGFVNGRSSDGQESIAWVLAQSAPVTVTEWNLDTSLCDLAPAEYDRQWRWWVEVVEEAD